MTQKHARESIDYRNTPVSQWSIRLLTDALTIDAAASLLGTSRRSVYTVRNTNVLSIERRQQLISAVALKHRECIDRLALLELRHKEKIARRDARKVA